MQLEAIGRRMQYEEVEDVFDHCLVIHWTCMWRQTVVVEILRCGLEVFNSRKSLIERWKTLGWDAVKTHEYPQTAVTG
jgi:hypothetical protein